MKNRGITWTQERNRRHFYKALEDAKTAGLFLIMLAIFFFTGLQAAAM